MDKQEFKDLTGENPEDVFGADWENQLAEYSVCEKCGGETGSRLIGDETYNKCGDCGWITH